MVNWKTYKIIISHKLITVGSNLSFISFELDSNVVYYGGERSSYIYCEDYSPFSGWREDDYIEIDNDQTRRRGAGYKLTSTTEVRLINCPHECSNSHAEYESLKTRYNSLERERNNLRDDRDDWREKYEEKNEELNRERLRHAGEINNEKIRHVGEMSRLQPENTRLREKSRSDDNRIADLTRQLTDSRNKVTRLEISLTGKNGDVQRISTQLSNLRIEREAIKTELTRERDERITQLELQELLNSLWQKDEEISSLRSQIGQSRESGLKERIRNKEQRLENFVHRLGIEWGQIQLLREISNELVRAQRNGNMNDIEENQAVIEAIKQNLLQIQISLGDVQEICEKCEEIAQLKLQLEQQFEARVEVPTNY